MKGLILPGGNKYEFSLIEDQLRNRHVNYHAISLNNSGIIFIIESGFERLPSDEKGYYLPVTDDSGHSIYDIDQEIMDELKG